MLCGVFTEALHAHHQLPLTIVCSTHNIPAYLQLADTTSNNFKNVPSQDLSTFFYLNTSATKDPHTLCGIGMWLLWKLSHFKQALTLIATKDTWQV